MQRVDLMTPKEGVIMFSRILHTATFWTSLGGIIGVVGMTACKLMSVPEAMAAIVALVQAMNIRNAIAKQSEVLTKAMRDL